jgi:hypothetical protein
VSIQFHFRLSAMKPAGLVIIALLICATVVSGEDACTKTWECVVLGEKEYALDCMTTACFHQALMEQFCYLDQDSMDKLLEQIGAAFALLHEQIYRNNKELELFLKENPVYKDDATKSDGDDDWVDPDPIVHEFY